MRLPSFLVILTIAVILTCTVTEARRRPPSRRKRPRPFSNLFNRGNKSPRSPEPGGKETNSVFYYSVPTTTVTPRISECVNNHEVNSRKSQTLINLLSFQSSATHSTFPNLGSSPTAPEKPSPPPHPPSQTSTTHTRMMITTTISRSPTTHPENTTPANDPENRTNELEDQDTG